VRALVETGALAGERGAYRLTGPVENLRIPATVQAILAARIDRLGPEAKRLLQATAVIGKDVPIPLLLAGRPGLPGTGAALGAGRLTRPSTPPVRPQRINLNRAGPGEPDIPSSVCDAQLGEQRVHVALVGALVRPPRPWRARGPRRHWPRPTRPGRDRLTCCSDITCEGPRSPAPAPPPAP
jgi:hypothetical protein